VKRREVSCREDEFKERLYPLVESRVFHVTRRENVPGIVRSGGVSPNLDGTFPTTFGSSSNSFFKNRGCVSLFDLLHPTPQQIESRLPDCWPFQPAKPGADIAILLISPAAFDDLVPWERWKEEEAWSEMVVPYVEAGYPGLLPLSLVDEIIEVEVQAAPDSVQAAFRQFSPEQGGNGAV